MRQMLRSIAMATALLSLALVMGAPPVFAGDPDGRPAAAKSLDPDQLSAVPASPGNGSPQGVAPGSITAPSRSPDSLVAPSRSPGSDADETAGAGSTASGAGSPDLSRLPVDAGGEDLPRQPPRLVAEPAAPRADAAPAVVEAWRAVQAADRELEAAQAAYTKMMLRNYPLGAARVRIEKARVQAIEAVNRARGRYARLAGPPR